MLTQALLLGEYKYLQSDDGFKKLVQLLGVDVDYERGFTVEYRKSDYPIYDYCRKLDGFRRNGKRLVDISLLKPGAECTFGLIGTETRVRVTYRLTGEDTLISEKKMSVDGKILRSEKVFGVDKLTVAYEYEGITGSLVLTRV